MKLRDVIFWHFSKSWHFYEKTRCIIFFVRGMFRCLKVDAKFTGDIIKSLGSREVIELEGEQMVQAHISWGTISYSITCPKFSKILSMALDDRTVFCGIAHIGYSPLLKTVSTITLSSSRARIPRHTCVEIYYYNPFHIFFHNFLII